MKKSYQVVMIMLGVLVSGVAMAQSDVEKIKEVIEKGYVHGAFNELNPEAMRKTFHEDFAIYSPKGTEISKYPIDTWASGVEKRKSSPEFKAEDNKWEHKFDYVDVTGNAAAVKIELHKDGKHVYTDYLSLSKFDNGWRIVAKVYHKHE
ncbi:hypothetical protein E1176_15745 [Fulvivirga sp. RKSG066]|uniref:nuclear transport factor 2 family protein n=1 Tax=Fulvivirga aurantia TaxID=2529383 RepID=UPI0012BD70B5|nr:nuclear transport factor 2 family protein [Fulvivirga aurantia]MTI22485.1 hypothetical protein [Fulvivirga aurantia]